MVGGVDNPDYRLKRSILVGALAGLNGKTVDWQTDDPDVLYERFDNRSCAFLPEWLNGSVEVPVVEGDREYLAFVNIKETFPGHFRAELEAYRDIGEASLERKMQQSFLLDVLQWSLVHQLLQFELVIGGLPAS